jgi:DUF1009 family protein
MSRRLTILAGTGALVPEVISRARAAGDEVQVLPLVDRGDLGVRGIFGIADLPRLIWRIKAFRSTHVTMIGGLRVSGAEREAFKRFAGVKGSSGDAALLKVAERLLAMTGARVVGAEAIAPEILAERGSIAGPPIDTGTAPALAFAMAAARALGRRDLGQAVVVAGDQVVAEEDAEGTDALLDRLAAGRQELSSDGPLILAKALKPQQSRLSDRPAIGPETVRRAANAGITIIAVEAGGAVLVDRARLVALAVEHGVSIVGVAADGE